MMMRPNTAFGSATDDATISGRRDEANHPALEAVIPVIVSIAPSHSAGLAVRRASLAPPAEPSAIPMMNDDTTMVKA